jgi:two-component system, sensor histidine kinase and response regulator
MEPKRTIWVADDSPLERRSTAAMLAPHYDVVLFTDGSELLEQLGTAGPPDLIVLDWVMPQVSGLEVLQFLRMHGQLATLPIVVLTATTASDELSTALLAGADDFVRKPVDASELRARVARLLARRDASETVERNLAERWLDERKRATDERHQRDEAEERARLAQMFMAVLGHDLRTPLSAIVLAAAVLEKSDLDKERRIVAASRIRTSIARMGELIGRVLDLARVRLGGGIVVERSRQDARAVCEQVIEELRSANPSRKIEFVASGTTQIDLDPGRFAQVVSNLVANAVQHGIVADAVDVRLEGDDERILLEVRNTGRAISQELAATLFEPFRRAADKAVSATGSMGLGLYISKQIVEAHGGSITLSSSDTVTSFVVTLPRLN